MAGLQTDDALFAGLAEAKKDEFEYEQKRSSSATDCVLHELDGIHDGLQFSTDEERDTLRRVADKVPWNAYRELLSRTFFQWNCEANLIRHGIVQSSHSSNCQNDFRTTVVPLSSYVSYGFKSTARILTHSSYRQTLSSSLYLPIRGQVLDLHMVNPGHWGWVNAPLLVSVPSIPSGEKISVTTSFIC